MPDIAAEGAYSVEGQDQIARSLLGPEGAVMDEIETAQPWLTGDELREAAGGQAVDQGEEREEHKLSPLDEVRAEWQGEEAAQLAEQAEAEAAQQAYEQSFQDGLANYDKLPPEEQFQVSTELVGRGLEGMAPLVNYEQAAVLNNELFAGSADGVAAATTLAFFADNVIQTLEGAGITDPAQLTPELAQQLTDPSMAHLFATNLCHALRMTELLQDGIVDPMTMSATLLPHVPALLSGQNPDLFPREYKQQFARDIAIAFGQRQILRQIDPDAAVALFDQWAKWGGRLRQGLEYHRQQQSQAEQAQPSRRSARSSRQAKPTTSRYRTNSDLFDSEMEEQWQRQHGGV
jgi:hypothetical protein